MPATGWYGRLPAWVHIANIVVFSVAAVGGLVSGHTATAVWFGGLTALPVWALIRRRRVERRPAPDPSQMVGTTILVGLGLAIFFLGTAVAATTSAVQASNGDRVLYAVLAAVLYAGGAFLLYAVAIHKYRSRRAP